MNVHNLDINMYSFKDILELFDINELNGFNIGLTPFPIGFPAMVYGCVIPGNHLSNV